MYQSHLSKLKKIPSIALKMVAFSLFALMLHSHPVRAQEFSNDRPAPAGIQADELAATETKWMKKKLKLTKVQLKQVEVINLKYAEKLLPLVSGTSTEADKKKTIKALNDLENAKEAELEKILDPEQMAKYRKQRGEIQSALQTAAANRLPGPPPPGVF